MSEQPQLSRRERRLEEQAAATAQLAPPAPRIAPISSYSWDREADREPDLPLSVPLAVVDPVDLYRDIPSRWSSASVWLIAFMPWITALCLFAALLLEAWDTMMWQRWGAVALPYLLTVTAAQRDVKRLRIWRHPQTASWAWSLLGAPVYLIVRTAVVRRNTGLGSAPLWVWLVNLLLVAGAVVYLLTVTGMYLASEGILTL